jgi:cystathionine beta-lyase/cystathionine gamma-synthase
LPEHPTAAIANKIFNNGHGGIVTFDLKGNNFTQKQENCNTFIKLVSHDIHLIPTLGDADTILMPVEPVWGDRYPYPGMVRLSIGIEPPERLMNVLKDALDKTCC